MCYNFVLFFNKTAHAKAVKTADARASDTLLMITCHPS